MKLRSLFKPEYCYRPGQILRRLKLEAFAAPEVMDVSLPWGTSIRVHTRDAIGQAIVGLGVYDLTVTETLFRLVDPGELALDIGANVGYMTAVIASRVGTSGTVWAFEAHPAVFAELAENVEGWSSSGAARFELRHAAVSDSVGIAELHVPIDFAENRGHSSLEWRARDATQAVWVEKVVLDELFPEARIGVMKLDVEGHEAAVLRGARRLLSNGRLRDVIFEEHRPYPTNATAELESAGYTLFALRKSFWQPAIRPVHDPGPASAWEAPSMLATRDPDRACARLAAKGWRALRGRIS